MRRASKAIVALLLSLVISACAGGPENPEQTQSLPPLGGPSPDTRSPGVLLSLQDPRINESSGLAAAADLPGVLYTHNDNGDTARFYAVGENGMTRAVYHLPGADAVDWEDMSAGPRRSLWFGDIGSNKSDRSYISVYRVTEPSRLTSGPVPWIRYDFRYADGRVRNAEALLIHPINGRLYIATKQNNGAAIYQAPRALSRVGYNTLRPVADIPPVITGGAFSHDGRRLVLRSYNEAYLYVGSTPGPSSIDAVATGAPTLLALPTSGESVTFTRDDRYLLVGQEGVNSPVWALPIRD